MKQFISTIAGTLAELVFFVLEFVTKVFLWALYLAIVVAFIAGVYKLICWLV